MNIIVTLSNYFILRANACR